jgi:hypothetical protein
MKPYETHADLREKKKCGRQKKSAWRTKKCANLKIQIFKFSNFFFNFFFWKFPGIAMAISGIAQKCRFLPENAA